MKFLTTFASALVLCSLLAHPYVDAQSAARETGHDVAVKKSTPVANPNTHASETTEPAVPKQARREAKKPVPKQAAQEEEQEEEPVKAAPKKAATKKSTDAAKTSKQPKKEAEKSAKKSTTPKTHSVDGDVPAPTNASKAAKKAADPSASPAKKTGTKAGTKTGTKTGSKEGSKEGEAKKTAKKGTKKPTTPKEPEVPAGLLEVKKCTSSNNAFLDLKWVQASPFPLTAKSPLSLRIHGNFPHGLERGSKLDIFARVLFFSQTVKLDICEELETSKAKVKCPLAPGVHTLQLVVPKEKLQPFNVNIQAKARDAKGRELFCFNTIMGFDQ